MSLGFQSSGFEGSGILVAELLRVSEIAGPVQSSEDQGVGRTSDFGSASDLS